MVMGMRNIRAGNQPAATWPPLKASTGCAQAVLHNNLWDCNYPLWYPFAPDVLPGDADERFRFRVWWD